MPQKIGQTRGQLIAAEWMNSRAGGVRVELHAKQEFSAREQRDQHLLKRGVMAEARTAHPAVHLLIGRGLVGAQRTPKESLPGAVDEAAHACCVVRGFAAHEARFECRVREHVRSHDAGCVVVSLVLLVVDRLRSGVVIEVRPLFGGPERCSWLLRRAQHVPHRVVVFSGI